MPIFRRHVKANDPGWVSVRTPERVMRGKRVGNEWEIEAHDGLSCKILKDKGWKVVAAAQKPAPAPVPVPEPVTIAAPVSEQPAATSEPVEAAPEPKPVGRTLAEVFDEADLAILDKSVKQIRKSLAKGTHDDCLDDLLAAEEAGNTRKGAVDAIKDRMAKIA